MLGIDCLDFIAFPRGTAVVAGMSAEANPDNPIDDMKACLQVAKDAIAKSA